MLFIHNQIILLLILIKNINSWKPIHQKGFFGMIGIKDIEINKRHSIYDVFTKDGILQGVFIDNDKNNTQTLPIVSSEFNASVSSATPLRPQIIHTVKHLIRTEKIKWNIHFSSNFLTTMIFNFIRWITNNKINLLGTANTALFLDNNNKLYALFERDLPYELLFDYNTKQITTGKRKIIKNIQYFSGHSKKRVDNNNNNNNTIIIDSIENDVSKKRIIHNIISGDLKNVIKKTFFDSKYIPFVHDFYILNKDYNNNYKPKLLWVDSPFSVCLNKNSLYKGYNIPIGLDSNNPTFFHVDDEIYTLHKSICIFHIAYAEENDKYIDIYASVYDKLHFSEDIKNINGNYCCIRLYKNSQYAELIINNDLEKFNLDFPIMYKNMIILRNIENNITNGFVICNKLQIVKNIIFENNFTLIGEPVVIFDDETLQTTSTTSSQFIRFASSATPQIIQTPYLLFFSQSISNSEFNVSELSAAPLRLQEEKKNYLTKINLDNYEIDYLQINTTFNIGFHSIWINSFDGVSK